MQSQSLPSFSACYPKLSILSKGTASTLTLIFSGFSEFLAVRSGSNLASLLQVVNTVALDFSADDLSFLDSSQSCEIFQGGEECNWCEHFCFVYVFSRLA